MKTILGLTGTHAAGKGTFVDWMKAKGYGHFSARDLLWEEVDRRNMERNRTSLGIAANSLREQFGAEHVAYSLYVKAHTHSKSSVIESIYTPAEITKIREAAKTHGERFILVAIDADQRIRYERSQGRKSETDRISFEQFQAEEAREMESTDPRKHNLVACRKLAELVLPNNGGVDDFHTAINAGLSDLGIEM